MKQRKRILVKQMVTFLLVAVLVLPSGVTGLIAHAATNAVVFEIGAADILEAVTPGSPETGSYGVERVPSATVGNGRGGIAETYPLQEEAVYAAFPVNRVLGDFLENLVLPYEREEDSVLVRMELLEALEGKLPVKTMRHGGVALIAAVDLHREQLVMYAVNPGGNPVSVRLVVRGPGGQALDMDQVSLLIRSATKETLTEAQLSEYRDAVDIGVEVRGMVETVYSEASGDLDGEEAGEVGPLAGPEDGLEQTEDAAEPENPEEMEAGSPGEESISPGDAGTAEPHEPDPAPSPGEDSGPADETAENEPDHGPAADMSLGSLMRVQPMRIGGGSAAPTADGDGGAAETTEREYTAIITREFRAGVDGGDGAATLNLPPRAWAEMAFDLGALTGAYPLDARHTVTFDPLNGVAEWSVGVEDGTAVPEPPLPTIPKGMVSFLGWYEADAAGEGNPYDFTAPLAEDLRLEARYSEHYVVQYKTAPGEGGKVIHTQLVPQGRTVPAYEPNPEDLELAEGLVFQYWYVEGGNAAQPFQFGGMLADNVVLVPQLNDVFYVVFQSGGSPVETAELKNGESVDEPVPPARPGFTFLHWSQDSDGGDAYDFSRPVESNLTLYGIWAGHDDVRYTLVYWVEKPDLPDGPVSRADYTYAHSEERKGEAGSTIRLGADDLIDFIEWRSSTKPVERNNALAYSVFDHSEEAVISGDGTTLVNLYYNRIPYQVTFDLGDSTGENGALLPGLHINGREYTGSGYTITTKYEQDISALWPGNDHLVVSGDGGATWEDAGTRGAALAHWDPTGGEENAIVWATGRDVLASDMIPADPATTAFTVTAGYTDPDDWRYISYRIQALDQDQDENDPNVFYYDNRYYLEAPQYSGYIYPGEKTIMFKVIDGLLPYGNVVYDTEDRTRRFPILYYNRDSYYLNYDTQGAPPMGSEMYMFEQPVFEPYEPDLPGHTFAGWYTQPVFTGSSYDFEDAIMPANDITLFARWDSDDHTVRFYQNKTGAQLLQTQGVQYGFTADLNRDGLPRPGDIDPQRGEFLGWSWNQNGAFVQYPSLNPVYGDYDLYGNWKNSGYTVTYALGEGATGSPVVDGNAYSQKALAQVQPPPADLAPPEGKAFAGWLDGKGETHYPYNLIRMLGDAALTAKYVDISEAATLTYHANDGSDGRIDIAAERGAQVPLLGEDAFARDKYTLTRWSTSPGENNGVEYAPGGIILLEGDTDLYAVWKLAAVMEVSAADVSAVYDGKAHRIQVKVTGAQGAKVEYRLPGGVWSPAHPPLTEVADSSLVEYRVSAQGLEPVTGSARVEIAPRRITARANNTHRTYTGRNIAVTTGGSVVSGSLVGGQTLTISAAGNGTRAGWYPIIAVTAEVHSGKRDETDNYDIRMLDGTLVIERVNRTGGDSGGGYAWPHVSALADGAAPGNEPKTIAYGLSAESGAPASGAMPSAGGIPVESVIGLGVLLIGSGGVYKWRKNRKGGDAESGDEEE